MRQRNFAKWLIGFAAMTAIHATEIHGQINTLTEYEPQAVTDPKAERIGAWRAMRFGLFIHWGPSAGRGIPHSHGRISRFKPDGTVPAEVYDKYYLEFNPVKYDPDAWLKLAYAAGMRYTVFVTKHHDGFSMFNSAATDYDIMATPYGKDVAMMFAEACRRNGMALGWYYSPRDWHHPDFDTPAHDPNYNRFYLTQMEELGTHYGPVSVMWFDGAGPMNWKTTLRDAIDSLRRHNPGIVMNNRGGAPGDFETFEISIGPLNRETPWEMCETTSSPSPWAYMGPTQARPLRHLLRNLVYCAGRDGNYLLNLGPLPDGSLYPPEAERLGEIAQWMKVNAEGIHGTRGGPYRDGDWGAATCKGKTVFLFLSDCVGSSLELPELPGAKVLSARRLDGGRVSFATEQGRLRIDLGGRPGAGERPLFTCVALQLDKNAFPLPIVDAQQNLVPGSLLSVSNTRSGDTERWGVQRATDGDPNTCWDTDPKQDKTWLQADLGETRSIAAVVVTQMQGWAPVIGYELQASAKESGPWETVFKGGRLGEVPVLEFGPVQARYLRLNMKPLPNNGPYICDFRIYAPLAAGKAKPLPNAPVKTDKQ